MRPIAKPVTKSSAKRIVVAATVAWALLGLASVIPAMFSVMMFDAPGSTSNLPTIALVASLMSFPFACVIALVEAWGSYRREDYSRARCWAGLPLINLTLGGAAVVWILLFQDGKFAG